MSKTKNTSPQTGTADVVEGVVLTEAANNTITSKARYWVGVLYPENMRQDWETVIGELLQLPYVYCIHNADVNADGTPRKVHVHLMIAFPNTTTYKNALEVFNLLSADGCKACNTVQKVINVRYMYNYLIHDTEDSRKKHKHLYDLGERVCGNCFDIGGYEQLDLNTKKAMRKELAKVIFDLGFMNYLDFYAYVISNYDDAYEEVVTAYSGHFERLTKGNFQKWRFADMQSDRE